MIVSMNFSPFDDGSEGDRSRAGWSHSAAVPGSIPVKPHPRVPDPFQVIWHGMDGNFEIGGKAGDVDASPFKRRFQALNYFFFVFSRSTAFAVPTLAAARMTATTRS